MEGQTTIICRDLLVASDASELVASQRQLIEVIEQKKRETFQHAKQMQAMADHMRAAKMNPRRADKLHKLAIWRHEYLKRVADALGAGFVMMPDMPGDIYAIRTEQERRDDRWNEYRWRGDVPDEPCESLPTGAGEYKSPIPKLESVHVEESGQIRKKWRPKELKAPDHLHRSFVRPEVVERTAHAMSFKIFDEIVTVRQDGTRRNRDPIVLGRVVDNVNNVVASFLIAWFVDAKEL